MEDVVLIVSDDRAAVEADLAAGRLLCPCCGGGVLGGWGCARLRQVRTHAGVRWLRPRRGRCRDRGCGTTHVLLPDVCLARRCYVAEVVGAALLSVGREGYRRAGERLGVPGETVRGWRQRFRSLAELIGAHFLRWARTLDTLYIDWFNHRRLHESLDDIPPVEFEQLHAARTGAFPGDPSVAGLSPSGPEPLRTRRFETGRAENHLDEPDPAKTAPNLLVDETSQLVSLTLGSDHHQHMETY